MTEAILYLLGCGMTYVCISIFMEFEEIAEIVGVPTEKTTTKFDRILLTFFWPVIVIPLVIAVVVLQEKSQEPKDNV